MDADPAPRFGASGGNVMSGPPMTGQQAATELREAFERFFEVARQSMSEEDVRRNAEALGALAHPAFGNPPPELGAWVASEVPLAGRVTEVHPDNSVTFEWAGRSAGLLITDQGGQIPINHRIDGGDTLVAEAGKNQRLTILEVAVSFSRSGRLSIGEPAPDRRLIIEHAEPGVLSRHRIHLGLRAGAPLVISCEPPQHISGHVSYRVEDAE